MNIKDNNSSRTTFNLNDLVVLSIFGLTIYLLMYGWHDMHDTFNGDSLSAITLDPVALPYYTLRTTMRLLVGMVFSMIFAIVGGALAANYAPVRRVLLPFVNFMESVPLVGFLTFTTIYFLKLYPNNVMGLECAAIFGVFTGQAWNMMLTVYQTMKIVPDELIEATNMFKYNQWQRFWRLDFLYSVPGLLWNTMVSQSAAWFALIASEAIPVKDKSIALPGVGSYIAAALDTGNVHAVIYSVIALIVNIIILDQLVFRPLVKYSAKFKFEDVAGQKSDFSWFYNCLTRSTIGYYLGIWLCAFGQFWLYTLPKPWYRLKINKLTSITAKANWFWSSCWYTIVVAACIYCGYQLWEYFPKQYLHSFPYLMLLTAVRVTAAMVLSIIIFVPLGIWIGLNPTLVRIFEPIIQILAAIPANIFYPLIAVLIITMHASLGFWSIFMIMLGTQWYVLFNVIAGVIALPNQLIDVSRIFKVRGLMWWRKFMIPAIFPYIVTGIISAAGGAWNTAIASEVLRWGTQTTATTGLGAFIAQSTANGQNPEAALGCTAMCLMVALCIIFVWQPLYRLAEKFRVN